MSKKYSAILREVRKIVELKKEHKICYAIYKVRTTTKNHYGLQDWVMGLLSFKISYEGWMTYYHPRIAEKMSDDDYRNGRLAWLDWMIAYWEKEEAKNETNPP
jgi:regulator of RNase E activity RraB